MNALLSLQDTHLSLGSSLVFSGNFAASALSGNRSFTYNQESGTMVMNFEEFEKMYNACSKTYSFIIANKRVTDSGSEKVITYQPNEFMSFVGEYSPGSAMAKQSFYINVDGASFKLELQEFEEVAIFLRGIRDKWTKQLDRG